MSEGPALSPRRVVSEGSCRVFGCRRGRGRAGYRRGVGRRVVLCFVKFYEARANEEGASRSYFWTCLERRF